MKAIKNVIFSIVIGLMLFSIGFSVVMADITYNYTGQKFTDVGGNYTKSQKITGSFTLPMRLPPNQTYSGGKLPVFSFSDGINKLNDKNTSRMGYYLTTNSKGNIKDWSLHFERYEPDPPKVLGVVKTINTATKWNDYHSFDVGAIGICYEITDDYCSKVWWGPYHYGYNDDNLGLWEIIDDTGKPSRNTGLNVSKAIELARYASDLTISRLPTYYYIAQYLTATCPVSVLSCAGLAAEIAGVALVEGFQVGKIVKDPPDPLYSEIFQPRQYSAFVLDSSSGFSQELIDAANAVFRDKTELASLLEAWRVTLERYNAAQAVNDQSNMLRQAAALDDYIIQTSRLATLAQQSFNEFLDQLEELTGPVLISPDQMQEAMNTLALEGFSNLVLNRLSSFGFGSAEIEELRSTLLQAQPLSDTVDFYSVTRLANGGYGELAAITRYVVDNNLLTLTKAGSGSGTATSDPAGIDCGANCLASFESGTSVSLTVTPAADSTFAGWSPGSCGSPFTLTADTTCTATFNRTNRPPVANAGPDRTVECTEPIGASVTLDGSGSSDLDGDPLTFTWTGPFGTQSGAIIQPTIPLGAHDINLAVADGKGGTANDTANVTVRDTTSPTLGVTLSPNSLWPPNHKMVTITANVQASDTCDPNPTVTLVSITSNEPDNGLGDGDTPNDIQGAELGNDDRSFALRAERSGTGTGRLYTVTYQAKDRAGKTSTTAAQVVVPHD